LIRFHSIEASSSYSHEYGPESVDDFSVTEDSCLDFWLLPDNQSGYIHIKLHSLEPIKKILLLNTGNASFVDRGSSRLEIIYFANERVVKKMEVDIKPYPKWTTVLIDKPVLSDAIRISVLSWTGNGGGINEVKVFR
jgi:hypothetical protein